MRPEQASAHLAGCQTPLLVAVRHHSPACAWALPELLDAFQPDRLLLELPTEFASWLEWLGDPGLTAPVALAAVPDGAPSESMAFYPFADFSPELAAVRWCRGAGVPVEAFDLPVGARHADVGAVEVLVDEAGPGLADLLRAAGVGDSEDLWDRLVEARAVGASAESVRRAGLLVGWAMRLAAASGEGVPVLDLRRETHMRGVLDRSLQAGERVAVVVGAFHAPALLPEPWLYRPAPVGTSAGEVVTSLIPYTFDRLDSRSGYPAGIRDPGWQQGIWQAGGDGALVRELTGERLVAVCRALRGEGHASGVPDAKEALRLALDLASLRGLAAPGRRELIEAIHSGMGQGELMGRGRALARAMEGALVGRERGVLATGTPRSGLAVSVPELLRTLRLPGPAEEAELPRILRLDPLRSDLDRRRAVALRRLEVCGVPYGQRRVAGPSLGEALTESWDVQWTPATDARVELAGLRGVTLEQACEGMLRLNERRLRGEEGWTAPAVLAAAEAAAEAGLFALASERLARLMGDFLQEAGLVEVIEALALVDRVARGQVPGLPASGDGAFTIPARVRRDELLAAALAAAEGVEGSVRDEDARALLALVYLVDGSDGLGSARLGWLLDRMATGGSPLIQGTAGALRVLAGRTTAADFGQTLGSWVDGATSREASRELTARLRGATLVAAPLFEADPEVIGGLVERVEALEDEAFLARLTALRGGFDGLSPAARQRLLDVLAERLDVDLDRQAVLEDDPEFLGSLSRADAAGAAALEALGLGVVVSSTDPAGEGDLPPGRPQVVGSSDRWRLILGREKERLQPGQRRAATALDELYGGGRGEGSRADLDGGGGGKEAAFPSAREWADELEALFGTEVREEVLAKAAEAGSTSALLELDAEQVTPSVDLLREVLSLKGALPESKLTHLRRVVGRIVEALVRELAVRLRPALTGITVNRPTLRPGGPLDLRRTVERNLKRTMVVGGERLVVPEEPVFRSRARRSMDWHVLLLVDVSGSMEPSVIYSAMMAAILQGVPALSVQFLVFSTEVIDLTEHVDDPLGLLLEVQVGGGTWIAKALRAARERMVNPARTLVVVVSDFEEGYSVEGLLSEVRALVQTGATALGLAALDDRGVPRYARGIAQQVVSAGMPVAALTPMELARWVGEQVS